MKKLRKLTLLIVAAVLAVGVLVSNLSFIASASDAPSTFTFSVDIPDKVDIGDTINLPDNLGAIVYDPTGNEVSHDGNSFIARLAGYYAIDFYGPDNFYYNGYKVLAEAPEGQLKIAYNGADIPTFINAAATSKVKFPLAEVVIYDDDGELDKEATEQAAKDWVITLSVVKPDGTVEGTAEKPILNTGVEFTYDKVGTYFVKYVATYNSSIKLTKDFTVKAQADFEDTEKPTMTVVGVPTEYDQRVKLTLPKASATDNFDENVKITITVTAPDGKPVKAVDDTDEKSLVVKAEDAVFDNDRNMSFYPMEEGRYKVTYTAADDSGNEVKMNFDIDVVDRKAPVIVVKENSIPTKWGMSIVDANGDADPTLRFPIVAMWDTEAKPESYVWDNVSDSVTINFSLREPNSGSYVYNSASSDAEPTGFVIDEDNGYYCFNVNSYTSKSGSSKYGEYVATYTAEDAKRNQTTKTFRVNIMGMELKATKNPEVEITSIPSFMLVGDMFTKPVIVGYGRDDSGAVSPIMTDVAYTFIPADGGDGVKFDFDKKSFYKPEKEGVITVEYTVTDLVGNSVSGTKTVKVKDASFTNAGTNPPTVELYDYETGDEFLGFDKIGEKESRKVQVKAVIEYYKVDEYLGYELIVRKDGEKTFGDDTYKGAGNLIPTTVMSIYKDNAVYDEDWNIVTPATYSWLELEIEFIAEIGVNTFILRGMDIGGKSTFWYDNFVVEGTDDDYPSGLASKVVVPTEIELGKPYNMPVSEVEDADWYTGMKVVGYQYEMKGNILIPKTLQGGWYFGYYYQRIDTGRIVDGDGGNFTIVDNVSPVFKLYDEVEAYKQKLENTEYYTELEAGKLEGKTEAELNEVLAPKYWVRVPEISVIDAGGIIDFKVSVKDRLGDLQKIEYFGGVGYFRPLIDGRYTITYEAADQRNQSVPYSVTIPVGKLIAPSLTVNGDKHPSSVKQGYELKYNAVTVSDISNNIDLTDKVKVTKTLYAPDGTMVSGSMETGTNASDKSYKLDIAGTYRVVYEAVDEAGNKTVKEFSITSAGNNPNNWNPQVLSASLIIVAILLVVFVLLYFFRFRKIKE